MRLNPRKPGTNKPLCAFSLAQILIPVNERTITARKRKALLHSRTLTRDIETQEVIPPSILSRLRAKFRRPFKRSFWKNRFEPTEDEVLVDSKLLSYAYLEAGMIEMLGT